MKEVDIVGVGVHKFGRFPYETIEEIGEDAVVKALRDANNMDWRLVQTAFCGTMHGGTAIGHRVLARIGLTGIPIINVETACASGSTAILMAVQAIRAGECDIALAFGVEKAGRGFLPMTSHPMWEHLSGIGLPPVHLALRATRYMYDYGATQEDLARVSVKNRRNGTLNPHAMYRRPITIPEVLEARMLAYPLTVAMLAPPCEGAAATIIAAKRIARKHNDKPVRIAAAASGVARFGTSFCGMGAGFDTESTQTKYPEITTVLANRAYEISGIAPSELDLIELNDNTAASELIFLEELGICEPGEAVGLIRTGKTEIGGDIAVNPSGGLLATGEPVGAVGVAQVAEAVWQLREQAGPRQVPNARVAMCEAAGAGGNCTVIMLTR